jgi:hypothetical protein
VITLSKVTVQLPINPDLPIPTPVPRIPAQSIAMLAGTDGLSPWLDIDRFHVSRRSFAPYPTAMVQGSATDLVWLCAIQSD